MFGRVWGRELEGVETAEPLEVGEVWADFLGRFMDAMGVLGAWRKGRGERGECLEEGFLFQFLDWQQVIGCNC